MNIKFEADLSESEKKLIGFLNTGKYENFLNYYDSLGEKPDLNFYYLKKTDYKSIKEQEVYDVAFRYYFFSENIEVDLFKKIFAIFDKQHLFKNKTDIDGEKLFDIYPEFKECNFRNNNIYPFQSLYRRVYSKIKQHLYSGNEYQANVFSKRFNEISDFLFEKGYLLKADELIELNNDCYTDGYIFNTDVVDYVAKLNIAETIKRQVFSQFLYSQTYAYVFNNENIIFETKKQEKTQYELEKMEKACIKYAENIAHIKTNYAEWIEENLMSHIDNSWDNKTYLHLLLLMGNKEELIEIIKEGKVSTENEVVLLNGIFKKYFNENNAAERKKLEKIVNVLMQSGVDLSKAYELDGYLSKKQTLTEYMEEALTTRTYIFDSKRKKNRAEKMKILIEELIPVSQKALIMKEVNDIKNNLNITSVITSKNPKSRL